LSNGIIPKESILLFEAMQKKSEKDNQFLNCYLLERLAFSFSFNLERVPVYSAFHTQLDLHVWFNRTLQKEIGENVRSVSL